MTQWRASAHKVWKVLVVRTQILLRLLILMAVFTHALTLMKEALLVTRLSSNRGSLNNVKEVYCFELYVERLTRWLQILCARRRVCRGCNSKESERFWPRWRLCLLFTLLICIIPENRSHLSVEGRPRRDLWSSAWCL